MSGSSLLTALLDRAEAAEVEPELVARLQALRTHRQGLRAYGRGR